VTTQLAYCQSLMSELKMSSFGPYAGAKMHSTLHYQLHSVEDRAKSPTPTVPQHCELMPRTCTAVQGSK